MNMSRSYYVGVRNIIDQKQAYLYRVSVYSTRVTLCKPMPTVFRLLMKKPDEPVGLALRMSAQNYSPRRVGSALLCVRARLSAEWHAKC